MEFPFLSIIFLVKCWYFISHGASGCGGFCTQFWKKKHMPNLIPIQSSPWLTSAIIGVFVCVCVSTCCSQGHYTRAQANSPRPVMNSSGSATKQGSQAQQQQSQHAPQQVSQQHQQQLQSSPGQQRGSRSTRRKGSDSSIPDDEKIKEEKVDSGGGRGGNLLLHCTSTVLSLFQL